jgi:anti-anti-sigma factor
MQYRPASGHQNLIGISTEDAGGVVVVTVAGEVDVYSASRLQVVLREAVDRGDRRPLIVDLATVTFFSSTGCAVLVDAFRQGTAARPLVRGRRRSRLAAGPPDAARRRPRGVVQHVRRCGGGTAGCGVLTVAR